MSKKKKPQKKRENFFNKNKLFFICLAIYIVLSFLLFDPKLGTGGDNVVYTILAESLISGKGYKNIYIPDEPAHTQYPFGFPLLLSSFLLVFGSSIIALKFLIFLTGCGALYFMYGISKHLFKDKIIFLLPFYLSMPIFVIYNHWLLSEIPFLCFSLGSLYFFIKARQKKEWFYYIAFILATYSFFIRAAGISLIIGMMFYLLLKKQFKFFVIFLIIFCACFIPWQMRNAQYPSEGNYVNQLLARNPYQMELGKVNPIEFISRIWQNFVLYAFTIIPMTILSLIKLGALLTIVGAIFTVCTIIGFIKKAKNITIINLYFVFAIAVMLIWPRVWSSERFLLPILPIIILYIFSGIVWLGDKVKSRYFIPVVMGIFVLLNIIKIIPLAKDSVAMNINYLKGDHYTGYTADWQHYFRVVEFIKERIPKEAIIMARKPSFVYLLSRHQSFVYPYTTDHNKVKEAIKKCDYILFDSFYWTGTTLRYLLPVIQQESEKYDVVYQTKQPYFYLLKPKSNL